MATAHLKGTADILYTPEGGTQVEYTLALPLQISPNQNFRSRRNPRAFQAWNADRTSREVFVVGTPVDEIEAVVRMDDDPAGLRSMLEEAMENDVTLTYRPTGSGGNTFPCKVLSAGGQFGEVVLTPDPDRFAYGEYRTQLVLRRIDGGDFEALL